MKPTTVDRLNALKKRADRLDLILKYDWNTKRYTLYVPQKGIETAAAVTDFLRGYGQRRRLKRQAAEKASLPRPSNYGKRRTPY